MSEGEIHTEWIPRHEFKCVIHVLTLITVSKVAIASVFLLTQTSLVEDWEESSLRDYQLDQVKAVMPVAREFMDGDVRQGEITKFTKLHTA